MMHRSISSTRTFNFSFELYGRTPATASSFSFRGRSGSCFSSDSRYRGRRYTCGTPFANSMSAFSTTHAKPVSVSIFRRSSNVVSESSGGVTAIGLQNREVGSRYLVPSQNHRAIFQLFANAILRLGEPGVQVVVVLDGATREGNVLRLRLQ